MKKLIIKQKLYRASIIKGRIESSAGGVTHYAKPGCSRIRRELNYDKVCSRSRTSKRRYNVGTGRGQRRSKTFVRQMGPQQLLEKLLSNLPSSEQETPSQEQAKPSPEQETPCRLSEQELEQWQDTIQAKAQQRNNFFASAASVGTHPDFNSILLMMQVLCSSKYLYGSWKLVFGEVDTLLVDL